MNHFCQSQSFNWIIISYLRWWMYSEWWRLYWCNLQHIQTLYDACYSFKLSWCETATTATILFCRVCLIQLTPLFLPKISWIQWLQTRTINSKMPKANGLKRGSAKQENDKNRINIGLYHGNRKSMNFFATHKLSRITLRRWVSS